MRRFLGDIGHIGVSHALIAFLLLGLQVFVARMLGLAEYGELATAVAVSAFFESVIVSRTAELALQELGDKWAGKDQNAVEKTASALHRRDLWLNWSAAIALGSAALLVGETFRINESYWLGLSFVLPAQVGFGISKAVFIMSGKVREQARFEYIAVIITVSFCGIGVATAGAPGYIISMICATALKSVIAKRYVSSLLSLRWGPFMEREPRRSRWEFFGLARNALANATSQMDLVLVNSYLGSEAAGSYKVAKLLAGIPLKIIAPIWGAVRPRLMAAWYSDPVKARKLIVLPSLGMIAGLVAFYLPAYFLAGPVVELLFGARFLSAAPIFLVLLGGTTLFHGITGWFTFMVVIGKFELRGLLVYSAFFLLTLVVATTYGAQSTLQMAYGVSGAMVVASALAWMSALTFRSR